MSVVASPEVVLFRVDNPNAQFINTNENTVPTSEKIEFGVNATNPDNRSGYTDHSIDMDRTPTSNPAPFQQVANNPDTGFNGIRYNLRVTFFEKSTTAGAIARLRNWYREENALDLYPEGRIGIRNDWRPEWDLTPTVDAGYKLVNFSLNQTLSAAYIIPAVITLEFSGEACRLGI